MRTPLAAAPTLDAGSSGRGRGDLLPISRISDLLTTSTRCASARRWPSSPAYELGDVAAPPLDPFFAPIGKLFQRDGQAFGIEDAPLQMIDDGAIKPVHTDGKTLAPGFAHACRRRAGVVAIHAAGTALAGCGFRCLQNE
ncbi:hypothetical protein FHS55_000012 [Angulomicrobium tetraedrale]|uniref:Uncharacterized protein n=1 Tax=Ancylobacter tetraedralis TaxID=217068 RepID=A0A839Z5A2_9HYPH|nr:hypothetical protein [Ancylobacter tetraedralis]MBB3769426.1 hypothetical protein [Ancylobacter tetraedralis]